MDARVIQQRRIRLVQRQNDAARQRGGGNKWAIGRRALRRRRLLLREAKTAEGKEEESQEGFHGEGCWSTEDTEDTKN